MQKSHYQGAKWQPSGRKVATNWVQSYKDWNVILYKNWLILLLQNVKNRSRNLNIFHVLFHKNLHCETINSGKKKGGSCRYRATQLK